MGLYFPFAGRAAYPSDCEGRHLLISQQITVGYTAVAGAIEIAHCPSQ